MAHDILSGIKLYSNGKKYVKKCHKFTYSIAFQFFADIDTYTYNSTKPYYHGALNPHSSSNCLCHCSMR